MLQDWQTSVTFIAQTRIDPDDALDFMERYGKYGTVAALSEDGCSGELVMSCTADSPMSALEQMMAILLNDALTAGITITSVEAVDEQEVDRRIQRPLYPEVVGFAEIARMAHVSRQRARQFPELPSFPQPVIETAQGPLFMKSVVEAWLENRNTKVGRPKRENAVVEA